jgi:hypothetical protein
MKNPVCTLGAIVILGAGLANGQDWTQASFPHPLAPAARLGAAMTYVPGQHGSVLFGGLTSSRGGPLSLSDTWLLTSGTGWHQLNVTGPSPRFNVEMVWDSLHNQAVLFGGGFWVNNGIIFMLNDTWTWNGSSWTQQFPANSPLQRHMYALAYDQAHNRTVLFGGYTPNGYIGDTWVYDGVNWTQMFPANSPSPRSGSGMAWDGNSNRVILFGGVNGNTVTNDTWAWDGTNWTQLFPAATPVERYAQVFCWDNGENQAIMFAGTNEVSNLADTWAWNGSNWTQYFPALSPTMRFSSMMDFDLSINKMVLFGGGASAKIGDIYVNDTWGWW